MCRNLPKIIFFLSILAGSVLLLTENARAVPSFSARRAWRAPSAIRHSPNDTFSGGISSWGLYDEHER